MPWAEPKTREKKKMFSDHNGSEPVTVIYLGKSPIIWKLNSTRLIKGKRGS